MVLSSVFLDMVVLSEIDICVDSSVDSEHLDYIAAFLHYSLAVSTCEVDELAIVDCVAVVAEPVALVVAEFAVFGAWVVVDFE